MLFSLRDSAYEAKNALETGDMKRFGELLPLQFNCMKKLHPSTSNDQIEELFDLADSMILGGKPCGAGGGGCVLFLTSSASNARELREQLSDRDIMLLDVSFDSDGLRTYSS